MNMRLLDGKMYSVHVEQPNIHVPWSKPEELVEPWHNAWPEWIHDWSGEGWTSAVLVQ